MSSVEDLAKDLAELQTLRDQAEREYNKRVLTREVASLQRVYEQALAAQRLQEERNAAAAEEEKKGEIAGTDGKALDFSAMQFTPIKDYGWDQDKPGLIKIYLLKGLEGIGSHDKEAI